MNAAEFRELDSGELLSKENFVNDQELQHALNKIVTEKITELPKTQPQKGVQFEDPSMFVQTQKPTQITQDQLRLFLALQSQVDDCEKVVGQWQPSYKFTNIYSVIDHLQE